MRFFSLISDFTHEMAVRYCVTDYDRELAMVAVLDHEGERQIVGVGRLEADPNHTVAEYAVIVPDAWQGRGIGSLLTDRCLEIAKQWGVKTVRAETLNVNERMIGIFKNRKFAIERAGDGETIIATLKLAGSSRKRAKKKTAKKTGRKTAKKTTRKSAKKVAKKVAKTVAKKSVRKTARKAGRKVAKKAGRTKSGR